MGQKLIKLLYLYRCIFPFFTGGREICARKEERARAVFYEFFESSIGALTSRVGVRKRGELTKERQKDGID